MEKMKRIAEYIDAISSGKHSMELYREYEDDILSVEAEELFTLFFDRLKQGESPEQVLLYLDRLMHVFAQSLATKPVMIPKDSFIDHLIRENEQMANRMDAIKKILARSEVEKFRDDLLVKFEELLDFNVHYVKKENILFPYLEKSDQKFTGVSIMWSLARPNEKNT
jgi:uncharacterized protein